MTIHTNPGAIAPLPTVQIDGGTIFITCKENDRLSLSTTIERLIDMMDAMEPDCDLEDCGDDEPSLGWNPQSQPGTGYLFSTFDLEADGADDEYSHGWPNEGPQDRMGVYNVGEGEGEPELGWSANIDQTTLDVSSTLAWAVQDGEPDLGFSGIATGWRWGESSDDREDENEYCDNSDYEVSEGWPEQGSQGADNPALRMTGIDTGFMEPPSATPCDGSGVEIAKKMLKDRKRGRPQFVPTHTETPRSSKPAYMPLYELKASDFDRLPWA